MREDEGGEEGNRRPTCSTTYHTKVAEKRCFVVVFFVGPPPEVLSPSFNLLELIDDSDKGIGGDPRQRHSRIVKHCESDD